MYDTNGHSELEHSRSRLDGRRRDNPRGPGGQWWIRAGATLMLSAATAIALHAQTLSTLLSFDGADGAYPSAGLVQGTDGNLYGTTFGGGAKSDGTAFKVTTAGALTMLYSFCSHQGCHDGYFPGGGLVQGTNGSYYGTTTYGGTIGGYGTVFRITPSGRLAGLYTFVCSRSNCADGAEPDTGLVQAIDGNFYGTTRGREPYNYGTLFKITPGGTLTTLYSFCSQSGCTDGEYPQAGLIQATGGNFYGTTYAGGVRDSGTLFKITPGGKLTTLYSFCSQSGCTDGDYPQAGLIAAPDGNFYGTTYLGGVANSGTLFKITPGGKLTTLYSFCSQSGCTDGANPIALAQATDGNFYGTTYYGGTNYDGTIFKITPSGTLTTLYSFCSQSGCTDGTHPAAAMVQATDGNLYGTTDEAGVYGDGTVFSLSVGLGPLVETQPTFGKVGNVVNILGTNLTGATSVTFNGTAATFMVVSGSLITTKVPTGATSGKVQVVVNGQTLTSNAPFRVTR